jgi:hypothetical protein
LAAPGPPALTVAGKARPPRRMCLVAGRGSVVLLLGPARGLDSGWNYCAGTLPVQAHWQATEKSRQMPPAAACPLASDLDSEIPAKSRQAAMFRVEHWQLQVQIEAGAFNFELRLSAYKCATVATIPSLKCRRSAQGGCPPGPEAPCWPAPARPSGRPRLPPSGLELKLNLKVSDGTHQTN